MINEGSGRARLPKEAGETKSCRQFPIEVMKGTTMLPVKPISQDGYREVVFAKDQPEYIPLPALTDGQEVITSWSLDWKERIIVLLSGRVGLRLLTFGKPLQPIKIFAGRCE